MFQEALWELIKLLVVREKEQHGSTMIQGRDGGSDCIKSQLGVAKLIRQPNVDEVVQEFTKQYQFVKRKRPPPGPAAGQQAQGPVPTTAPPPVPTSDSNAGPPPTSAPPPVPDSDNFEVQSKENENPINQNIHTEKDPIKEVTIEAEKAAKLAIEIEEKENTEIQSLNKIKEENEKVVEETKHANETRRKVTQEAKGEDTSLTETQTKQEEKVSMKDVDDEKEIMVKETACNKDNISELPIEKAKDINEVTNNAESSENNNYNNNGEEKVENQKEENSNELEISERPIIVKRKKHLLKLDNSVSKPEIILDVKPEVDLSQTEMDEKRQVIAENGKDLTTEKDQLNEKQSSTFLEEQQIGCQADNNRNINDSSKEQTNLETKVVQEIPFLFDDDDLMDKMLANVLPEKPISVPARGVRRSNIETESKIIRPDVRGSNIESEWISIRPGFVDVGVQTDISGLGTETAPCSCACHKK